jgi:hypothetical protein
MNHFSIVAIGRGRLCRFLSGMDVGMNVSVVQEIKVALEKAVQAADDAGETLLAAQLGEALDCANKRLSRNRPADEQNSRRLAVGAEPAFVLFEGALGCVSSERHL